MDKTIGEDIRFIGGLLPQHYEVKEDKDHSSSFRCTSTMGLTEIAWERFTNKCREYFGKRLLEFYHQVNYMHKDFTVYLK
jgi:hypothetical protein